MYIQINSIEKDILREMFNIGISKAADAFSMLLKNRTGIILTVPDIKVITPAEFPKEIRRFDATVIAIRSKLEGDLNGITVLLFYEEQLEWIVMNCLSERELNHKESTFMRMSLLLEISNILSGAILTQFSNILGMEVHGLPPICIARERGKSIENIICDFPPCQPIILSVRTDFLDRQQVIELPLLVLLEVSSLSAILNTIRQKGIYENVLLRKQKPTGSRDFGENTSAN